MIYWMVDIAMRGKMWGDGDMKDQTMYHRQGERTSNSVASDEVIQELLSARQYV